MGVEHHIAKMTAHGLNITGEGFGGIGELSQTDIAAAMSGLHGPVYWYMRVKYCGDQSMLTRLVDSVAFQILGESMTSDVDVSAKTAKGLATAAVMQGLKGPICDDCHGTGNAFTKSTVKDCPACKGHGRRRMTKGMSANIAGVSRTAYLRQFEKVVDSAVARLESLESRGFAHVARQIYDRK